MRVIKLVFFILLFLQISTSSVNAIIAIVPPILIPIVSLVVWIISAIFVPVVALSAYLFKVKKNKPLIGIAVGLLFLIIFGLFVSFVIKFANPDRPFY